MQAHSLHRHDAVQGFGCSPTSVLQRKWCLYRQTHCLQMQTLYIRLPCLQQLWNLSMCFPNLKIILQLRPSLFKFNLKRTVIFLHKNFRIFNRRKQGELVPTCNFWIGFYKSSFKTLVGLRPNPIFSTKLRWLCILSSKGLMTHKETGIIQPSLFLPKFSPPFLATRRKWRIFKSSCWHSSILVVIYSNNLI